MSVITCALLTGLRGGRDLMNSRMISCALFFNLGGMSPFTWIFFFLNQQTANRDMHFKGNDIFVLWLIQNKNAQVRQIFTMTFLSL